jgi:DNA-binding transcriptional MerR regulator
MAYTIKEIADLAGVSTRTLRYYDEIGLLPPASTGDNGYRYYDVDSLLRLQQILFFRELGMPLSDIQLIMTRPDFNLLGALQRHRVALQKRARRLEKLIHTVDRTITTIKGEEIMSAEEYFEGFDESQYEEEARERWGDTPQYAESQRKWASYSPDQKEAIKEEGGRLTTSMVGGPEASPDDPQVQAAVGEYYDYINKYFYTCDLEFLRNLSDMWVQDARFAVNYERVREGGAEFVRKAVHIYCDEHKE